MLADPRLGLEEDDPSTGEREPARDGEAHDPGPDDDAVEAVHDRP